MENVSGRYGETNQTANGRHTFAYRGEGKPKHELEDFKPSGFESETNIKEGKMVTRGLDSDSISLQAGAKLLVLAGIFVSQTSFQTQ